MNDVLRTYFDWEMNYGAIDISGRNNSGGNAVKLRICVSRSDFAGSKRVLKVLRVLRFLECVDKC